MQQRTSLALSVALALPAVAPVAFGQAAGSAPEELFVLGQRLEETTPQQLAQFGNRLEMFTGEELELAGLVLRHRAKKGETRPEMSGHYHPRVQLTVRERRIRKPCAVVSRGDGGDRMILPAYGALTGGMNAADPAILSALQPAAAIDALVPAGGKLATFPLWRRAA